MPDCKEKTKNYERSQRPLKKPWMLLKLSRRKMVKFMKTILLEVYHQSAGIVFQVLLIYIFALRYSLIMLLFFQYKIGCDSPKKSVLAIIWIKHIFIYNFPHINIAMDVYKTSFISNKVFFLRLILSILMMLMNRSMIKDCYRHKHQMEKR